MEYKFIEQLTFRQKIIYFINKYILGDGLKIIYINYVYKFKVYFISLFYKDKNKFYKECELLKNYIKKYDNKFLVQGFLPSRKRNKI